MTTDGVDDFALACRCLQRIVLVPLVKSGLIVAQIGRSGAKNLYKDNVSTNVRYVSSVEFGGRGISNWGTNWETIEL